MLAGATVLRGTLGFGFHGLIKWSPWRIVEHVPIIVEIVDTAERIANFLDGSRRRDHAERNHHARTGPRDALSAPPARRAMQPAAGRSPQAAIDAAAKSKKGQI